MGPAVMSSSPANQGARNTKAALLSFLSPRVPRLPLRMRCSSPRALTRASSFVTSCHRETDQPLWENVFRSLHGRYPSVKSVGGRPRGG